ncbi:LacI family DNA-binding transcriptional regulator [Gordonia sp. NPDC127522]|uniref:LacI family DNA-binding transcriptional regulator n=1 Tax=Gordonia sp. NPDC127522 TaxID=3345390 RepID=UPI00362800BB
MREKRPTLADVAQQAGTSTAVVSYVINNGPRPVSASLRAKVIRAINELDYRPDRRAQALRRQRRWQQIGLLVPDVTLPLFGEFVGSLERHARARERLTMIGNTGYDPAREAEFVTSFIEAGIDGLIVVGASDASHTEELCDRARIPVVWMHNVRGAIQDVDIVGVDHVKAGELAIDHLAKTHQCADVAFVGGFSDTDVVHGDRETVHQRFRGATAGGAAISHIHTDLTADDAYLQVRSFLKTAAVPAGVIVGTHAQTAATTRALFDHGLRIPEDVKVVGFDGNQARYGQYNVTSIQQPIDTIADHALDRLLAPTPQIEILSPKPKPLLHIGNTCGCQHKAGTGDRRGRVETRWDDSASTS